MIHTLELCAALLAAVTALTLFAKRIAIPAPILLVPAGILLGFLPGLPKLDLDPQLFLILFLPPLVYIAAVELSWKDFWDNIRPISLLAVGCVLFTLALVAPLAHWLLPWLPWAACFALGAAISPPDAVAATSMSASVGLPRRMVTILSGEGVVNDATALTAYRFAVAAVLTGAFSLRDASITFGATVIGETLYGLALGWCTTWLWPRLSDPSIEIAFSLLIPFVAYLPPEQLGGSGVLATVVTGLYVGERGVVALGSRTRLSGRSVWETIQFLLENLLFLLTGLQLRTIINSLHGGTPLHLLGVGLALSLAVVVIRFIWVYPATYLPRWLVASIRERDPAPPWRYPFVIAFAGMRGGISLAAALAIPRATGSGQPFPGRNAIIFLTFCVIVATLVFQGLLLPALIRHLKLDQHSRQEREEDDQQSQHAWVSATEVAIKYIEGSQDNYAPHAIASLRHHYERRLRRLRKEEDHEHRKLHEEEMDLRREVLNAEREHIRELREKGEISEDVRMRLEHDFDLDEARLIAKREHPEDE